MPCPRFIVPLTKGDSRGAKRPAGGRSQAVLQDQALLTAICPTICTVRLYFSRFIQNRWPWSLTPNITCRGMNSTTTMGDRV